jgi:hypothetical protein
MYMTQLRVLEALWALVATWTLGTGPGGQVRHVGCVAQVSRDVTSHRGHSTTVNQLTLVQYLGRRVWYVGRSGPWYCTTCVEVEW